MGAGVVVRDDRGSFLRGCRCSFKNVCDPELAEAQEVKHVVKFALQSRLDSIIVTFDYQTVISKINCSLPDSSAIVAVIHDIKVNSSLYRAISFAHVNRACNRVAHVIAQSAIHGVGVVWVGETPEFFCALVCSEVFVLN
jgi:hypothetical protein